MRGHVYKLLSGPYCRYGDTVKLSISRLGEVSCFLVSY